MIALRIPFWSALTGLLFVVAACTPRSSSPKAGSTRFSSAFDGGYDPEAALQREGYVIQNDKDRSKTANPTVGYAWQSWDGTLTTPAGKPGCESVAVIIRGALNKALAHDSLDELTTQHREKGHPLSGMLRYNKDGMHGDVHVWLIPDESETTIRYVIFVREEILK